MPPHGGRWLQCQRRGRAGPQTPHSGVPWGHRCLRRAGGSRGRQAIQTPRCRANSSGFSDHLSPKHSGTQGPRCSRGAWPSSLSAPAPSAPRPLPPGAPSTCPLCSPPSSVRGLRRWFDAASSVYTLCRKRGIRRRQSSSEPMSRRLSEPSPGPRSEASTPPTTSAPHRGQAEGPRGLGLGGHPSLPAAEPWSPARAVT